MQLGKVIGSATSTIKHESMIGFRMLVVLPLGASRQFEGDPVIAIDKLGAGVGQTVVMDADTKFVHEYMNHSKSPARWIVVGIEDE
jgi:ethanolamine utilization protein EutN